MKKIGLTSKELEKLQAIVWITSKKVCKCKISRKVVGGFHLTTEGVFCNTCGGKR